MEKGFQINIRFSDSQDLEFLRQWAADDSRTLSNLIRLLIAEAIKAKRNK